MTVIFPSAFAPTSVSRTDAPVLVLDRAEPGREDELRRLRETVRRLERGSGASSALSVPLDVPEIDAVLPDGGLACGALHEIVPGDAAHDGAALGFTAAALGRFAQARHGQILWIHRNAGGLTAPPYAPALAAFVDPASVILASPRRVEDALWAMEEGLRCGALAAVVGEIDKVELAATRRLQLAAEKSGVPALLLRVADRKAGAISAAVTRWRVASAPSRSRLDADGQPLDDIGGLRWRLDLLRNRFGDPARTEIPSWLVEWTNEKGHLAVVPETVGRPHGAPAQRLAG
ncbi:MAG: damage-inducible mutagenesis protein [Alphaproteobacteria bacterium]|nr:damage-inducible mutagenesis protein [Alphaproteobacteria bacterium]MCW5739020.1 damage-inducible mutagenesis protein [Alphaproteobacteria bacterium]